MITITSTTPEHEVTLLKTISGVVGLVIGGFLVYSGISLGWMISMILGILIFATVRYIHADTKYHPTDPMLSRCMELADELHFLMENEIVSEDGTYTFPNGETWNCQLLEQYISGDEKDG